MWGTQRCHPALQLPALHLTKGGDVRALQVKGGGRRVTGSPLRWALQHLLLGIELELMQEVTSLCVKDQHSYCVVSTD